MTRAGHGRRPRDRQATPPRPVTVPASHKSTLVRATVVFVELSMDDAADSNRGHHDFQSCGPGGSETRNPWNTGGYRATKARSRTSQFAGFSTRFRRWRPLISSYDDRRFRW
jgi:hypothetical protein